LKHYQML